MAYEVAIGLGLTVLVVVLFFFANPFIAVPEGYRIVIARAGKFSRILDSGLNLVFLGRQQRPKWRYIRVRQGAWTDDGEDYETVAVTDPRLPMAQQTHALPPTECETKDGARLAVSVHYRLKLADLKCALYDVEDPYQAARESVAAVLRDCVGRLDVEGLEKLSNRLAEALRAKKAEWQSWGVTFCTVTAVDPKIMSEAGEEDEGAGDESVIAVKSTRRSRRAQEREMKLATNEHLLNQQRFKYESDMRVMARDREVLENNHRIAMEKERLCMLKSLDFGELALQALCSHNVK